MNFNFRNILPKSADNDFKGHKIAFWGFILFVVLNKNYILTEEIKSKIKKKLDLMPHQDMCHQK